MKIYTKTGDKGETGLFDGTRVPKHDPRVEAYGDVDELNALLGTVRAFLNDREIGEVLASVQRDLFAVGAQLADPKFGQRSRKEKVELSEAQVKALEEAIDRCETELPPSSISSCRVGAMQGPFSTWAAPSVDGPSGG